jgi:hypothetical protein
MEKPRNVRAYFDDKFNWETDKATNRCLDVALKLNVCYAAIETIQKETGDREVWAAVYLIRYVRNPFDGMDFGYKDMSEHMGPVQADCPARILDRLTVTDNENALEWRRRCREALSKRMPAVGTRVRFAEPVHFVDGSEEREFTVVRMGRRRKLLRGAYGGLFRISQRVWRDREWSVVH